MTRADPIAASAIDVRIRSLARCAAEWRDPSSAVRREARDALAGGQWPAAVVERALDNALFDLDEQRARALVAGLVGSPRPTLVLLPGNVIGPVIVSAFCAALAGAHAILKPASSEQVLAPILARQLGDSIEVRLWRGEDDAALTAALSQVQGVIAFGTDDTIAALRSRMKKCGSPATLVAYGDSYSIGYVASSADLNAAATVAARDICLFDQRGCMSPQTIYVHGDAGRATLFARSLAAALQKEGRELPRAAFEPDEPALIAAFLRRFAVSALDAVPHGLDTILKGPQTNGVPEFIVAVEPDGEPTCAGFGRIVVVKPCPGAGALPRYVETFGRTLETIGLFGALDAGESTALERATAKHRCELGDMQRPPFGYRPRLSDFVNQ